MITLPKTPDEPLVPGTRVIVTTSAHHMPDAPGVISEVFAEDPDDPHYIVLFDYGIRGEFVAARHVRRANDVLTGRPVLGDGDTDPAGATPEPAVPHRYPPTQSEALTEYVDEDGEQAVEHPC